MNEHFDASTTTTTTTTTEDKSSVAFAGAVNTTAAQLPSNHQHTSNRTFSDLEYQQHARGNGTTMEHASHLECDDHVNMDTHEQYPTTQHQHHQLHIEQHEDEHHHLHSINPPCIHAHSDVTRPTVSSMEEHPHHHIEHKKSTNNNLTSTSSPTTHGEIASMQILHASNQTKPTNSTTRGKSIKFQMENPSDPNYKSVTQKSNYKEITMEDMSRYFHLPQTQAADMLGVSLSTLKRRFYSFGIGRWPSYENNTALPPSTNTPNMPNMPNMPTNFYNNNGSNSNNNSIPSVSAPPSSGIPISNVSTTTSTQYGSNPIHLQNTALNNVNNSTPPTHTPTLGLHILASASSNVSPSDETAPPPPPIHNTINNGGDASGVGGTTTSHGYNSTIIPQTRVFTHEHQYVRNSPSTPPNEHPQSSRMYEEYDESILRNYQQKSNAPHEVHIHHHHYHIYQQPPPQRSNPPPPDYFRTSRGNYHSLPPPTQTLHSVNSSPSYPFYHYGHGGRNVHTSNYSPNSPNSPPNIVPPPSVAVNSTHHFDRPKNHPVPVVAHNQIRNKSPNREMYINTSLKEKNHPEMQLRSPPSESSEHSHESRRISNLYHPYQKQGNTHYHHYRSASPPPYPPSSQSIDHSRYSHHHSGPYGDNYYGNETQNETPRGVYSTHPYNSSYGYQYSSSSPNWEEKDAPRVNKELNTNNNGERSGIRQQHQNYR